MHSKKCTVKKYWQMLKYCFCTMIGSCTSCLYMRIEIHSCCPIFAAKRSWKEAATLPKTDFQVRCGSRLSFPHTSVCPLSNVTTLKLQSLSVLKKRRYFRMIENQLDPPERCALWGVGGGRSTAKHPAPVVDHVHVAHQQPLGDVRLLEHCIVRGVNRFPVWRLALLLHRGLLRQRHVVALVMKCNN